MSSSPDLQSPPGVVELREDVPLKAGSGSSSARLCAGGPRLILAAFATLTAAITLALLTQIYYGDYEVVPHGSVSSSAAPCSQAGTAALQAGGRALDAAAAAALCLAVLAPHRTSLDASGSLVYWEYRSLRTQLPTVVEWGGAEAPGKEVTARPPRLLVALAALHAKLGALPWSQVLQPAIDLARAGFLVTDGLALEAESRGITGYTPHAIRNEPALAEYLESLQSNTTAELCAAWSCGDAVRWRDDAAAVPAGPWRAWAAGAGGARAAEALRAAFSVDSVQITPSNVLKGVVDSLKTQWQTAGAQAPAGVASGLAVVDARDTYAALVTGLSMPFGSGAGSVGSESSSPWVRDEPTTPLDLAPAIIVDEHVCGTRYVMGAESGAALAEGAASALSGGGAGAAGAVDAVEGARVLVLAGGALALERGHAPPDLPELATLPTLNSSSALPALNFVQQRGDALLSHADSRGGGVASRF
ncbi:glutathione hydrolase 6-like [Vanessa cardui]|uniref:glutathione hydrolase 6-like n=1 Tax=Vanessa cardui TaxID=171605 RepID=UPI001F132CC3|nr:glutathione hydrolase 6-like [Vanessa cardui]